MSKYDAQKLYKEVSSILRKSKDGYGISMTNIKVQINKEDKGYKEYKWSLSNGTEAVLSSYFLDRDQGRQQLLNFILDIFSA